MGKSAHIRARRRRRARLSGRLGEERVARRAARDAQQLAGRENYLFRRTAEKLMEQGRRAYVNTLPKASAP
jgi:hypothetical protein